MCVCVCVGVCVGKREAEKEGEREGGTEKEKAREFFIDGQLVRTHIVTEMIV